MAKLADKNPDAPTMPPEGSLAPETTPKTAPAIKPGSNDKIGIERMSPKEAIEMFGKKLPFDRSGRFIADSYIGSMDVFAKDTPATEEFPDGMFGHFVLIHTGKIQDQALTLSIKGDNVIVTNNPDGGVNRERAEGTGKSIKFIHGRLKREHEQSMEVLRFLFHNPKCASQGGNGFEIDYDDRGGLWRLLGYAEVHTTQTVGKKKAV